jgi:Dolichyl-phosphate-mannose-protein mannosyltransferase
VCKPKPKLALKSVLLLDVILIVFLGVITFTTLLLLLFNSGKAMFNIDSYTYAYAAILIAKGSSAFSLSPFINILSLAIQVLGNSANALLSLRIMNIVFAFQLVVFVYLIARKIFDPFFSAFTALIASFLPLFQSYSITLHNDIFAVSMGFASLYFIMKPRFVNIVLAISLFVVSTLTRFDMLPVFIIPLVFGTITFIRNKTGWKFLHPIFMGLLAILLIEMAYLVLQGYYQSITRFNPVEKFILFVRADIIQVVLKDSISITGIELINNLYFYLILIGVLLLLVTHSTKFLNILRSRANDFKEADIAAVYLAFAFFASLLSLVVFHINYSIENDKVIFNYTITSRYFIPIQVLMAYGFTYALSCYSLQNIQSIKNFLSQKMMMIRKSSRNIQ